jgi:hypothetical protein
MTDMLEQSWYPSVVVKLTMRFDEALQIRKPRDETSIAAVAAQTQESRIAGRVNSAGFSGGLSAGGGAGSSWGDPVSNSGGRHRPRHALDAAASAANAVLAGGDQRVPSNTVTPGAGVVGQRSGNGVPSAEIEPLVFGTDGFTVIANRVPKKATFTLPHPRTAPTFTITFDYTEFPVDPRLLTAVGVEIHMGSVSAEDFARGMRGELDQDGRPLSILKTTTDTVDPFTGRKEVNDATLLFYGTADTWDVDHSESNSTVVLEGREIRSILIDTKVVPDQVQGVKLDQPITEVIGDLIQTIRFEHSFRLMAATDATEWPDGIVPSPGDAEGLTRVRLKAASGAGSTAAGAKPHDAHGGESGVQTGDKASARSAPDNGGKASYWDLITNYCEIVGAMPHIIGSVLWIRPVHRVFDIVDPNSKIRTPFRGGVARVAGQEQVRVRRLVLGREIKRLKIQRKFGGVAIVPTVQTISFDDRAVGKQRLIFGQWPPSGSGAAEAKAESELLRVPMWGIRSVERLTQIARGIYEEMGRGETGGSAETANLASFGGDNDDPDMLRLRPLEPIEFVVDASSVRSAMPISSDVNELARLSFSEEVDRLHERLGDRVVARALVALARGAVQEVLRYYQVVGVTFDWDKGVRTSLQFQNYVVPRHHEDAVSDVEHRPKQIKTRAVRVAGGGRKARAEAKRAIDSSAKAIQGVSKTVSDSLSRPPRPRPILTNQERGGRGLQ